MFPLNLDFLFPFAPLSIVSLFFGKTFWVPSFHITSIENNIRSHFYCSWIQMWACLILHPLSDINIIEKMKIILLVSLKSPKFKWYSSCVNPVHNLIMYVPNSLLLFLPTYTYSYKNITFKFQIGLYICAYNYFEKTEKITNEEIQKAFLLD